MIFLVRIFCHKEFFGTIFTPLALFHNGSAPVRTIHDTEGFSVEKKPSS